MALGPATRRQFLKTVGAASLGGTAGFAANLAGFNAFAADTSGYRALVCVFLFGGMDSHDLVIPHDQASYDQWASVRGPLIGQYAGQRNRDNLLELQGFDAGGRTFAVGQELAGLQSLFNEGNMAVVANAGPLIEPLTRETYQSGAGARPDRLFSHNDQQSTWMASQPEGAAFGWGGRLSDIMLAAGANTNSTFTAVSTSGNAVFLSGNVVQQFRVGNGGAISLDTSNGDRFLGSDTLPGILEDHYVDFGASASNLFMQDMIGAHQFALQANEALTFALEGAAPLATTFPDSGLGGQLATVARMIAQRDLLGASRQVFFVATGGYDTHSNQAANLPGLLGGVDAAMSAFYQATVELGVANEVTSFTASDFGRTLQVNGDGTDHGWGSHHLVVGGGVNGGQIFGDFPEAVFDHDMDTGRGRLIPGVSVEQYAAGLGSWFGLSESELVEALPGLANFDAAQLSGLMASSAA